MRSLFAAIMFISLGFVAGWRYGYKQVTQDIERIAKHILSSRG